MLPEISGIRSSEGKVYDSVNINEDADSSSSSSSSSANPTLVNNDGALSINIAPPVPPRNSVNRGSMKAFQVSSYDVVDHHALVNKPGGNDVNTANRYKLSEVWPALNKPGCNNSYLCNIHPGVIFWNVLLVVGHTVIYCAATASRLHWSTSIVAGLNGAFTLYTLFKATTVEPGILTRQAPLSIPKMKAIESAEPVAVITIRGVQTKVPLKYCVTCHILRPPKTSHCRLCDNCITKFDHHCPWINNCVGERNYKWFIAFLCAVTIQTLLVLIFTLTWMVIEGAKPANQDGSGFSRCMKVNPLSLVQVIFTSLILCCVGSLAQYHCYLIMTNMTTYEDINYSNRRRGSDGNMPGPEQCGLSWCSNLWNFFSADPPPSKINLDKYINNDKGYDVGGPLVHVADILYNSDDVIKALESAEEDEKNQQARLSAQNSALEAALSAGGGSLSTGVPGGSRFSDTTKTPPAGTSAGASPRKYSHSGSSDSDGSDDNGKDPEMVDENGDRKREFMHFYDDGTAVVFTAATANS